MEPRNLIYVILFGALITIALSVKANPLYFHTAAYLGSALTEIDEGDGNFPFQFVIGATYEVTDELLFRGEAYHDSFADVEENENNQDGIRFGVEYRFCVRDC